jgi:hypothetical protein
MWDITQEGDGRTMDLPSKYLRTSLLEKSIKWSEDEANYSSRR